MRTVAALLEGVLSGNKRAIARAMSLVERGTDESLMLINSLFPYVGKAYRIGITGPPGAGKSTLTAGLAKVFRQAERQVGIIAVDPTSPFSGGAVLGDRIRMLDLIADDHVFMRSMASRGSTGGLSERTEEVADVLDAAGTPVILIETVGVGQTELEIARAADCTVVVLVPESGDSIQAMKAGLMEIADIFVINKADRDGAGKMVREVEMALHLRPAAAPVIPVCQTVASEGEGIAELAEAIKKFWNDDSTADDRTLRRRQRLENRIRQMLLGELAEAFWTTERLNRLPAILTELLEHKIDLFAGLEAIKNGSS